MPSALFAVLSLLLAQPQETIDQVRYDACLDAAVASPEATYEEALAWRSEGGGLPARHCAAMALYAMERHLDAAEELEAIGHSTFAPGDTAKAEILAQAGEAYLIAEAYPEARDAFGQALELAPGHPDLHLGSAKASAAYGDFERAARQASRALNAEPGNIEAMIVRGDARMRTGDLDGAESDARQAIASAPDNIAARLLLGDVRVARETGNPPVR